MSTIGFFMIGFSESSFTGQNLIYFFLLRVFEVPNEIWKYYFYGNCFIKAL